MTGRSYNLLKVVVALFFLNTLSLYLYFRPSSPTPQQHDAASSSRIRKDDPAVFFPDLTEQLQQQQQQQRRRDGGFDSLKRWPILPSYLPWSLNPSVRPHSCEASFGNGFTRHLDLLSALLLSPNRTIMSSHDDDGPKLPQDVVVEILKRLPVGSLLRFRCVCRSWRSTIDDPRFVALHLNHSALDASNRYLVCLDWCDDQRLCSLFPNESLALHSQSPIEIRFVDFVKGYSLVGSCNGLICFTNIGGTHDQTMCLWNLFTRKHKVVRLRHMEACHQALGFGFDARSNDYKILRILYGRDDINRVQIYSLRTDSWRSLECEVPAFCAHRPWVLLNGNIYWFIYKHDDPRSRDWYGSIVSFDVAGEVFDEMALPETFHEDAMVRLAVLDDSLAVFNNFRDAAVYPEPYSICSVWILREHGVPESWTKLYSLKVCGLLTEVHGFMRNGELLMEIDDQKVSWNPITGQYTDLPLSPQCDLVTVVESLVSL